MRRMMMSVGKRPYYEFTDFKDDLVDRTTYNFTDIVIGKVAPNRVVVIAVYLSASGSTTLQANSVTVNGVAATQRIAQEGGSANKINVQFFTVLLSSGAIGPVTVVANRTCQYCKIAVYAAYGFNAVPVDTAGLNWFDQTSGSVLVQAGHGDIVLAAGHIFSQNDIAWTGVVGDFEFSSPTPDARAEGASSVYSGTRVDRTIGFSTTPAPSRAVTIAMSLPVV